MILIEKYRPKRLEDIIGLPRFGFRIDQNLPHLLLHGPPGTGKTSFARIVIRMLDAEKLELNASKDRGIDVIREQVSDFAQTRSFNGGIRIIFLDEADALTPDAQNSLRNIMETYAENCRFLLTANNLARIIEPLRSRCVVLEFGDVRREDVVGRLVHICESEGIPYERAALERIADIYGSDIRGAINKVDELRDSVRLERISIARKVARDILDLLRAGDFEMARQIYIDCNVPDDELLRDMYYAVWESTDSLTLKAELIHQIADGLRHINTVAWKQIEVEDRMLYMMEALCSRSSRS